MSERLKLLFQLHSLGDAVLRVTHQELTCSLPGHFLACELCAGGLPTVARGRSDAVLCWCVLHFSQGLTGLC